MAGRRAKVGTGASAQLSQAEADALLQQPKRRVDERCWPFPTDGGQQEVPLCSVVAGEEFILNIGQKTISLAYKFQMRARQVVVLARLDFGAPHRNPDGEEIGVPHLHVYREGYGDRWAYLVPPGLLSDPADGMACLLNFMDYCHVELRPHFQGGLF